MPSKLPAELRRSHRTIKGWITADLPLSETDVRRYVVLNRLIRLLETKRVTIAEADAQSSTRYLIASRGDGSVTFRVRERLRQHRRPLTPAEQRFNFVGQTSVFSLIPSSFLEFETGRWGNLKVIEEKAGSLLDQVPSIAEAIAKAIDRDAQRREADRQAAIIRAQRDEERARRREARERDEARWQSFLGLAAQWSQVTTARAFLNELKKHIDQDDVASRETIEWLQSELQSRNPLGPDRDVLQAVRR